MIYENVELHNIAETVETWNGGRELRRVPESVRSALNDGAKERSRAATNAEIRFTCSGPARVRLSSAGASHYYVAHGDFIEQTPYPLTTSPMTIEVSIPDGLRRLKDRYRENLAFDTAVYRIRLPWQPVTFFSVEGTDVQPPRPNQVPPVRLLTYGTSITEGGGARCEDLGYAAQTARRLGWDHVNLAMSGSCHVEPAMADYIASRDDWDIALLSLSVNMIGFEVEEFRRRVEYMVNTVAGSRPRRPVVCVTLFPFFGGLCEGNETEERKAHAFREILRGAVADCPHPNVTVVEGPDLLDTITGLSADLIHPIEIGMARIAENLAPRLSRVLAGRRDAESSP